MKNWALMSAASGILVGRVNAKGRAKIILAVSEWPSYYFDQTVTATFGSEVIIPLDAISNGLRNRHF